MKKINIKQIAIGAGLLITGLLLGRVIFNNSSGPVDHQDHTHETIAEIWTCSMHPQIRENGPGKCPLCGMDLIPVPSGSNESLGIDQIQMTESAMKLAAVQTVIVGKSIPQKQVYLPGRIEADERNISTVTAHFNGRVEKLYADFTGQYIKKGQRLAILYSPDLVTAQKELFEALKFKSTNPSFYESAIQKLKLWELTDSQIQSIMAGGEPQYNFSIYAPRSGTILARKISQGEHVMDGQVLFEIADLNRLWVLFDAYESDLPWINVGDSISFKVQSLPGETFNSLVTFIDPVVNSQTRTASVRTEIINMDNRLKPKMFVEGIINAELTALQETIIIPKTAVLWTGKRAVVYVKQPEFDKPTFQFREIELGTDAGEYYVVNKGLFVGEEIVTNGVFKIDGAAQLQGKVSMMNPAGGKSATGHQHSGDMPMNEIDEELK
ncbi:MAG: efflux RND transporter periplasmic adaptor subunit [Bacteroidetes bacterium]|nr:MAG: efflux RND transporter periplasmic adaptor subunit [Bacteroidota bacterium]